MRYACMLQGVNYGAQGSRITFWVDANVRNSRAMGMTASGPSTAQHHTAPREMLSTTTSSQAPNPDSCDKGWSNMRPNTAKV